MKRTIAFMMALALCVGTTATAFAEDTATEFSFTLRNDPTYTVTIPAQVTIEKDGTDVEVVAEDVENLAENEKISVTIAGTDYFRNQMVLTDKDTRAVMRYQIVTPDGRTLETTGTDTMTGQEIVSFTEDGTETYTVKPVVAPSTRPGNYKGTLTYGISVVEAE